MVRKYSVLILGSKEYPLGSNKGDDPIISGGIETVISILAPELAKECNIIIITRKFSGCEWHEGSLVEIYRVPWIRGKYTRTPSFIFFSSFLSFYLLLTREIDIIYAHGVIASFPAFFLSKLFNKPLICRPHGSGVPQWFPPINQIIHLARKFVFPRCDMIIFNSEGEKYNLAKNLGVEFDRFRILMTSIPVGKTFDKEELKEELGLMDKKVISYIGRLHPIKGIKYLIDAVEILREKDFKVLIVGDGPQKKELERHVREKSLEDKIIFTGFREDIRRTLASTDIFVLPSISEGLPVSLLEAMAAKRACIVSDIGLPVENMKTAIVVPPRDVGALAKAIELLLEEEELRRELGKNARKFIEENCNIKKDVEKHLQIFEEVIRWRKK
jgi:glycosyltransferase involved in cell wall biosynthesis